MTALNERVFLSTSSPLILRIFGELTTSFAST